MSKFIKSLLRYLKLYKKSQPIVYGVSEAILKKEYDLLSSTNQFESTSELDRMIKNPLGFYIKKYIRPFFVGFAFLILTNLLDAFWPLLIKQAIDQIELNANMSDVNRTMFFYFTVLVMMSFSRFGWIYFYGQYHTNAQEDLRRKLFKHIIHLSQKFFNKNPVGEIMSALVNDIQAFRQGIGSGLLFFIDGILVMLIVIPMMIHLNSSWTAKVLIFIPLLPFIIWKVMHLIYKYYKIEQNVFSELTGICQENVAGIRVVKSFAQENTRLDIFNKKSAEFERAANKVAIIDSFYIPALELSGLSGSAILLFIAPQDVLSGTVTIGTFVAYLKYIDKMIWPMNALGLGLSYMQKGNASFSRIKDIFRQQSDVPDDGKEELKSVDSLEFKNVSFKYSEAKSAALKNISFKVNAGESIGVVGPVGSGKSTLVQLLVRLLPVSNGEILINGKNIKSYTLSSIRKVMTLIPQEVFLFSDTIASNIKFGKETLDAQIASSATNLNSNSDPNLNTSINSNLDLDEVRTFATKVQIDSEIQNIPNTYDALIGERGVNLSGGQKQRIAIARGLILNSPVVILDDVLSALDTKTEQLIERQINSNKNQTKIIIAHRLSAIKSVDKIIVLKDGEIEATGNIDSLLKTSPTFRKVYEIQESEMKE